MFDSSMTIEGFDDAIFAAIGEEERRQRRLDFERLFHDFPIDLVANYSHSH